LTGQTQTGDHGTRVRLEAANFDALIAWLSGLQRQSGINIESAAIDRTDKSGIVNVTLVLTRGGS
jgi:type II secretory pathway component PulM